MNNIKHFFHVIWEFLKTVFEFIQRGLRWVGSNFGLVVLLIALFTALYLFWLAFKKEQAA